MKTIFTIVLQLLAISLSQVSQAMSCKDAATSAAAVNSMSQVEPIIQVVKQAALSFQSLGLKELEGPESVPGVIIAAIFAKAVAADLARLGKSDLSKEAQKTAVLLNDWIGLLTDGTKDIMRDNSLDLPDSTLSGADLMAERFILVLDQVGKVEKGPNSIPALIVAIEIAKKGTNHLRSMGREDLAKRVADRNRIANDWLGYFSDGMLSRLP